METCIKCGYKSEMVSLTSKVCLACIGETKIKQLEAELNSYKCSEGLDERCTIDVCIKRKYSKLKAKYEGKE